MTQDQSMTRAVVPGIAILGAAAAQRENDGHVGGTVVPGIAVLGSSAPAEIEKLAEARRRDAMRTDANAAVGKVAEPEEELVDDAKLEVEKLPPLKPRPAMTEKQIGKMLEKDPDAWEVVLELELQRPDFRVSVAKAILAAAPDAVENEVPQDVLDRLNLVVA